jgi:uncharacterized protein (DUF983 family)
MFGKGSKLYSIFNMKCPRCHEGAFFKTRNAYNFKHMAELYDRCPVCGQTYEPEPNFYYGSMYVSYGYTVAIFVAIFIVVKVILGQSLWTALITLGVILLIGGPYLFRLSRITWLNMFVKYKPQKTKP